MTCQAAAAAAAVAAALLGHLLHWLVQRHLALVPLWVMRALFALHARTAPHVSMSQLPQVSVTVMEAPQQSLLCCPDGMCWALYLRCAASQSADALHGAFQPPGTIPSLQRITALHRTQS